MVNLGKNFFLGLLFDLIDWVGFGFIPFVADILDVLAALYWYRKIGALGALPAIEILPFADILPVNILTGYIVDQKEHGKGGKKK
jgi:hypothetical protein